MGLELDWKVVVGWGGDLVRVGGGEGGGLCWGNDGVRNSGGKWGMETSWFVKGWFLFLEVG